MSDIVDGKPSIILGLIWTIILYFQVNAPTSRPMHPLPLLNPNAKETTHSVQSYTWTDRVVFFAFGFISIPVFPQSARALRHSYSVLQITQANSIMSNDNRCHAPVSGLILCRHCRLGKIRKSIYRSTETRSSSNVEHIFTRRKSVNIYSHESKMWILVPGPRCLASLVHEPGSFKCAEEWVLIDTACACIQAFGVSKY